MRVCDRALHVGDQRIERAQPHGVREMLDREVWLALPHSRQPAVEPCPRQIGIERHCPIDQGHAGYHVVDHVGQRKTRNTQSDGVVLAKLRRAPRQPFRLADLALLHPAAGLALHPAPCRHAVGRGKAWVELEDRKSTRLNSSHVAISYAVFCLKKKKKKKKKIKLKKKKKKKIQNKIKKK